MLSTCFFYIHTYIDYILTLFKGNTYIISVHNNEVYHKKIQVFLLSFSYDLTKVVMQIH